jgi:pyruvate-ferredoxin/flavodoxin oxidoreductase
VKVLREAASWRGPSLVIAYSHCIAHGIDMSTAMSHQREAVQSGYWPLYRYDPRKGMGEFDEPFSLDSRKPRSTFKDFAAKEGRFAMLTRAHPERAEDLFALAQADIDARWHLYEQMAGVHRSVPDGSGVRSGTATDEET